MVLRIKLILLILASKSSLLSNIIVGVRVQLLFVRQDVSEDLIKAEHNGAAEELSLKLAESKSQVVSEFYLDTYVLGHIKFCTLMKTLLTSQNPFMRFGVI